MTDVWNFLVACWMSGTLLRSVCALVVVPTGAWLAIRLIAPMLARGVDDPGWQAPLAAAAASIPGLLLILLATAALIAGTDAACRDNPVGQVLFTVIVSVSALSLARALVLSARRLNEAERLVRASLPADARLARLAARASISARVIEDDALCFVLARVWRPVVLVSSAALERLSDLELSAALHHERGHARRGDQLIAAALSFLVDLVPLPAMDLVHMYRRAREIAADHHALRDVEATALASALLRFVRPRQAVAATAALGGESTIRERLRLLLSARTRPKGFVMQRVLVTGVLAAIFAIGLVPAAVTLVHPVPCTMSAALPATSTLA